MKKNKLLKSKNNKKFLIILGTVIILSGIGFGSSYYYNLHKEEILSWFKTDKSQEIKQEQTYNYNEPPMPPSDEIQNIEQNNVPNDFIDINNNGIPDDHEANMDSNIPNNYDEINNMDNMIDTNLENNLDDIETEEVFKEIESIKENYTGKKDYIYDKESVELAKKYKLYETGRKNPFGEIYTDDNYDYQYSTILPNENTIDTDNDN